MGFVEPADHALGRSRGGLSSKVHLCCDGRGLPLSFTVTAGQAGDNPQLLAVLDAISVPTGRPGRPRRRLERLLADKAYSHPAPGPHFEPVGSRRPSPNATMRLTPDTGHVT